MTILTATPETMAAVWPKVRGGDTLKMVGVFKGMMRHGGDFSPSVTLDLTGAVIDSGGITKQALGWYARLSGVVFKGGELRGANPLRIDGGKRLVFDGQTVTGDDLVQVDGNGIWLIGCEDIEVKNGLFQNVRSGVVGDRCRKAWVHDNGFSRMGTDGCQFGSSQDVTIEDNRFAGFMPPAGAHPDCVQLWSRATSPPCADIVIRRNKMQGRAQGVGMFNHTRSYPAGTTLADGRKLTVAERLNDGGFDRVLIEDNDICVAFPHGICVSEGRDVRILRNAVSTYPQPEGRASINVSSCTGLIRSGNTVAPGAGKRGDDDADVVKPGADISLAAALDEAEFKSAKAELAAAKAALADRDAQLAARTAEALTLADGVKALSAKIEAARLVLA